LLFRHLTPPDSLVLPTARLAGHTLLPYINSMKGVLHIPKNENAGPFDVDKLKDLIVSSLDDDKAQDIEVINLGGQTALADYIVVASGTSSRQITRMAEKLRDKLSADGYKNIRLEGLNQANWVVFDAGDIIVHLFRPEVREFYNIEKMWSVAVPSSTTKSGGFKSA